MAARRCGPKRGRGEGVRQFRGGKPSGSRLVAGDAEVSLHPLGEGEVTLPWVVPHAACDVGLDGGEVVVRGGLRCEGCRSIEQPVGHGVAVGTPAIDPRATFGWCRTDGGFSSATSSSHEAVRGLAPRCSGAGSRGQRIGRRPGRAGVSDPRQGQLLVHRRYRTVRHRRRLGPGHCRATTRPRRDRSEGGDPT